VTDFFDAKDDGASRGLRLGGLSLAVSVSDETVIRSCYIRFRTSSDLLCHVSGHCAYIISAIVLFKRSDRFNASVGNHIENGITVLFRNLSN
jgi:hypothetical protein